MPRKGKRTTVDGIDPAMWGLLGALARMQRVTIGAYINEMIRREWETVMGPVPGAMVDEEEEEQPEEEKGEESERT